MFNRYYGGNTLQSIKINAVSGAILKNHPKSWFERFHLNSSRAKALLKEGGHEGTKLEKYTWCDDSHYVHDANKDIIVLQMMVCGDMEVLAECVYGKDYYSIETEEEALAKIGEMKA